MFPFQFSKAADEASALEAGASGARYVAGGTTLIDLMRETVERPESVVDINALPYRDIDLNSTRLRVGSLVRMTDLAAHPGVRQAFPMISQALELSASAQLRNMASIGGNLMQRPRCLYFRDVSAACNRRNPGSGCSAIDGYNRTMAILGASDQCVATHPSDLAVALTALDATVFARDRDGDHPIRIADFFRQPGDTPDQEHNLRPGQIITAVEGSRPPARSPVGLLQGPRPPVVRIRLVFRQLSDWTSREEPSATRASRWAEWGRCRGGSSASKMQSPVEHPAPNCGGRAAALAADGATTSVGQRFQGGSWWKRTVEAATRDRGGPAADTTTDRRRHPAFAGGWSAESDGDSDICRRSRHRWSRVRRDRGWQRRPRPHHRHRDCRRRSRTRRAAVISHSTAPRLPYRRQRGCEQSAPVRARAGGFQDDQGAVLRRSRWPLWWPTRWRPPSTVRAWSRSPTTRPSRQADLLGAYGPARGL